MKILILSLFLTGCAGGGVLSFLGGADETGKAVKNAGVGIGAARVGEGIENIGEARKIKAQAKVEEQKTKQKESDNEAEIKKHEIEMKSKLKEAQLKSEDKTTDSILSLITKSKDPTQTLKLATLGHELKKLSIISKASITIAEERYKFQIEKAKSDNQRILGVATSRYNGILMLTFGAILGVLLSYVGSTLTSLLSIIKSSEISVKQKP